MSNVIAKETVLRCSELFLCVESRAIIHFAFHKAK